MAGKCKTKGNVSYLGTRFYYEWNIDSAEKKLQGNDIIACASPVFSFYLRNALLDWKLHIEEQKIAIPDSDLGYRKRFKVNLQLLACEGLISLKSTALIEIRNADLFFCKEDRRLARGSAATVFKPGDSLIVLMTSERSVKAGTKQRLICKIEIDENKVEFNKNVCSVCDDLGSMLSEQKSCDVTLKADNHEVMAHKAILAGRSRVFAAMFENDMQESSNNEVEIEDIKFEILEEMLQYIYTGTVKNMKLVYQDLLVAADKYCLENLKIDCEKEFCKSLSIENCVQCLILAEIYSSDHLMNWSKDFILKNISQLITMDDWKVLEEDHPKLLAMILRELVKAKPTPT